MDYSTFKSYLQTFLWKDNDTVLSNNLDNLILMANSELNRKLDIQRREVSTTIAPEQEDYSLPSDFGQILSISNLEPSRQRYRADEMRLTTKSDIMEIRSVTESAYIEPVYYVQKAASVNTLFLVGPFSASAPGSFDLTYRTDVPDYATADTSWLADDYLDLYVYTVLKHTAPFLREDERVPVWKAYQQEALDAALDEDKRLIRFGGSPLKMKPHRYVPQTRRT